MDKRTKAWVALGGALLLARGTAFAGVGIVEVAPIVIQTVPGAAAGTLSQPLSILNAPSLPSPTRGLADPILLALPTPEIARSQPVISRGGIAETRAPEGSPLENARLEDTAQTFHESAPAIAPRDESPGGNARSQRLDAMFDQSGDRSIGFVVPEGGFDHRPNPGRAIGFRGDLATSRKRRGAVFGGREISFTKPYAPDPEPSDERTILLTGFEPGDGEDSSQAVAASLDGYRLHLYEGENGSLPFAYQARGEAAPELPGKTVAVYRIIAAILPLAFNRVAERTEALIQQHRPNLMLMLAAAQEPVGLAIEPLAKNLAHSPDLADADGTRPFLQYVLPGGPAGHAGGVSAPDLARWLSDTGVPTSVSADPGSHVPNGAFYLALNTAAQLATDTLVTMVRLPSARGDWPLDRLMNAAGYAAQWLGWVDHAHASAPDAKPE